MAFPLLLVAALSAFALIPLTPPHFFASSDGLYHVYRAIEVDRCLRSGVLVCAALLAVAYARAPSHELRRLPMDSSSNEPSPQPPPRGRGS